MTPQPEPPPIGSEEPAKGTEGGESMATSIAIETGIIQCDVNGRHASLCMCVCVCIEGIKK